MLRSLLLRLLLLCAAVLGLYPALERLPLLSERYDWRYFDTVTEIARRSVRWYGEAPLWNPYSCGGEVDLANPQSMVAAPTFLLVLLFGTAAGLKLAMLCYYLLALDGGYRLARHLGASEVGAALAALGFGLSGYQALHLASGHANFAGVCLYPYLLLCYDRALTELEWAVPGGLVAAWIAALGGTFTAPMAGLLLVLWGAASAARDRAPLRPLVALALVAAVGLLCGAVRALPVLEFIRDHPRPPSREGVPDVSAPWQVLGDLVTWRRFAPVPGRKYWGHEYAARLPWAVTALALAGLAALRRLPRRAAVPALCLAVLGLLLSMGHFSPAAPWPLLQRLPVLRALRVPSRFEALLVLAVALLGALGWDALAGALRPRIRERSIAILGIFFLVVAAADGALYTAQQHRGHYNSRVETPAGPVPFFHVENHWRIMREVVFSGRGALGCDEEAPLQRAEALDSGEVPQGRLLDPAAGTVLGSRWSPNRRVVEVELSRGTVLLLNSNWNEHFRTAPGRVTQIAGRLAVDLAGLPPGRHTITVRYAPRSFFVGAVLSAISLPAALLGFVLALRRRRQS